MRDPEPDALGADVRAPHPWPADTERPPCAVLTRIAEHVAQIRTGTHVDSWRWCEPTADDYRRARRLYAELSDLGADLTPTRKDDDLMTDLAAYAERARHIRTLLTYDADSAAIALEALADDLESESE